MLFLMYEACISLKTAVWFFKDMTKSMKMEIPLVLLATLTAFLQMEIFSSQKKPFPKTLCQ